MDMLFPEIAVDNDSWRGLLPVILYNLDQVADQPEATAGADKRSERANQH